MFPCPIQTGRAGVDTPTAHSGLVSISTIVITPCTDQKVRRCRDEMALERPV